MSDWEELVKEKVPASAATNTLILYDHLPNILEDIADIFERSIERNALDKDDVFRKIIHNSVYHGRHRASTLEYTNEQVIHEYIIFRDVLTEKLIEANCHDNTIESVLKYTIETAMLKSADAFAKAIQEMQEKLIGTLAHDIRNPLSAAQISLQMMGNNLDEEMSKRMMTTTSRSLEKAISLIEGLMDSIAIRAGEGITLNFEELNIVEPLKAVYKEASDIYTQKIVFTATEDSITGIFDETSIRRLLENLITNAVKHGDGTSPIQINLTIQDKFVFLSVKNNGNPIDQSKQENIFEFLSKEKSDYSSYRNWGMGLALVKMVAEAHGGKIKVESNEKDGTTFTARFNRKLNKSGKKKARLNNNAAPVVTT